ncbi:Fanconi anemia group A protein homolog [Pecten maximus]|uniref:Fanconi anemia group A protein homolog n=1 Tax=Pecten maximus TaxID=6579 RepID=UPI00145897B8|nr:Fanconi anemia group A protein homolog [Pecten maximus]
MDTSTITNTLAGCDENFFSLIESRNRKHADLTEDGKSMLKEAVIELISYHQDLDQVFNETTSILNKENCQDSASILCSSVQGLASSSATSSDFIATEACANKIVDFVRQRKVAKKSSTIMQEEITAVVMVAKDLMESHNLQRSRFYNLVCKEICLPLDVIWTLHETGVMTVEVYLSIKQNEKSFVEELVQQIFDRLDVKQDKRFNLEGFINHLSQLAFPGKIDADKLPLKKLVNVILDSTILKLVDTMTADSNPVTLPVATVQQGNSVEGVRKQYSRVINLILTHRPTKALSAFSVQGNLTYPRSPPLLVTVFKQLLLAFDNEELIEILRQIQDQPINWPRLLTLVSTFVVCQPAATERLLEFVYSLLRTGLERSAMDQMAVAFLLARQVCLEGTHVAMSYQDWFQKMFGDGARSLSNTRKTFMVLMRFFTDLVPYESTTHLKVHILRPPFVPPTCRELLTDYIMLAKTRLADLKDPIDLTCERQDGDKAKILEQTEKDVQLAVSTFEGTNKIPSSVMEASIFRKPYFIGRFLLALLKPRPLPDVPDVRMRFIDMLKRVEKIPPNMYSTYVTACHQEADKLLQGVFLEDDITEMTMDPIEDLDHRLSQLVDKVALGPANQHYNLKEPELMSLVREKISVVLNEDGFQSPQQGVVTVDSHSPQLSLMHVKVVDLLLNVTCKLTSHSLQTDQPDLTWASQLFSVIGEFPTLHKALYTRIWKLIMENGSKPEEHHIQGIAMSMCQMSVQYERFGEACVKVCGRVSLTDALSHLVWSQGSLRSAECMRLMLRLSTAYFQCVFSCLDSTQLAGLKDKVIPRSLVTLFVFLCCRLLPETRNHYNPRGSGEFRLTHLIYRSKKFTECCQHIQLTFKEWVTMEMTVCRDVDFLSFHERREYLWWCIYQKFLCTVPRSDKMKIGSEGLDVREASSILMETLIWQNISKGLEATTRCGQCHRDRKTGSDYGGQADFVHLLQEMVTMLPNTGSEEDCGNPWLLQQLFQALKQHGRDTLGTEAILHHFIHLAMCLPAHLFYCDNVHKLTDFGPSCDVINKHLKHGLCHGSHFPLSVTQYLIQGMADCAQYTDVSEVFLKAPILSISALIHVQQISGVIAATQTDHIQDTSVILIVEWLQRYLSGQREAFPEEGSSWMIAAALLLLTLTSEEIPQNLLKDVTSSGSGNDILAVYCHLVLAELSSAQLCNSETKIQILQESCVHVLQSCPMLLTAIVQPVTEHLLYTTDRAQRVEHLTLLRILCKSETSDILRTPRGLVCVIMMFGNVVQLFDQGQALEGLDCEVSEVLSIQEVLELSEFVKECIKLSSVEQLNCIESKNTIKMCGPDIYVTFKQRLSTIR